MTDDSDPFAPFRQMFEQFDPSGGNAGMPAMGVPLSPLAMMGSNPADTSPEDATKRAVRQLYGTLDAMGSAEASGDVWTQYLDAMGVDASSFGTEQLSAAAVRTYRIWFYSLTQLLVETYSLRLVQNELVVDTHSNSTRTQKWLWGLPQSDREQLLLRCTEVDDELVREMEKLRQRRDSLLYSFGDWESVEFDESIADMRRVLDVLTALDDLVTDGSTFSYVPDAPESEQPSDTDGAAETENTADSDG